MRSVNHPGIATEFVIFEYNRDWYTTYFGSDEPIILQADTKFEAREEAAEYWGMDEEEIKFYELEDDDPFHPDNQ